MPSRGCLTAKDRSWWMRRRTRTPRWRPPSTPAPRTWTPRRWRRRRDDLRVLGVDPGNAITGYGVIETGNGTPGMGRLIECGVFRFGRGNSLPHRLAELHHEIAKLIKRLQPSVLALEDAFYHKNVRTTLVLGHARGGVLLAAQL